MLFSVHVHVVIACLHVCVCVCGCVRVCVFTHDIHIVSFRSILTTNLDKYNCLLCEVSCLSARLKHV